MWKPTGKKVKDKRQEGESWEEIPGMLVEVPRAAPWREMCAAAGSYGLPLLFQPEMIKKKNVEAKVQQRKTCPARSGCLIVLLLQY